MCVNYITVSRQIAFDWFRTPIEVNDDWREEIYRDYKAPFIIHDEKGERKGKVGTYAFVPQDHRPKRNTHGQLRKQRPKVKSLLAHPAFRWAR